VAHGRGGGRTCRRSARFSAWEARDGPAGGRQRRECESERKASMVLSSRSVPQRVGLFVEAQTDQGQIGARRCQIGLSRARWWQSASGRLRSKSGHARRLRKRDKSRGSVTSRRMGVLVTSERVQHHAVLVETHQPSTRSVHSCGPWPGARLQRRTWPRSCRIT